jgi:hypothetical protein
MEIDLYLKNKVQSFTTKHYYVDDDNYLRTSSDESCSPSNLYDDVINIFGLDNDFAYLVVVEWLFINEMANIKLEWCGRFTSPGVSTIERDNSICFSGTSNVAIGMYASYGNTGGYSHAEGNSSTAVYHYDDCFVVKG